MNCPNCSAAMVALTLDGHTGTSIAIDACEICQVYWFDTYESLRLAPTATLKLFTRIGDLAKAAKVTVGPVLHCPRCRSHLQLTHDRQRDTPFEYWRCDHAHGRLITFFNFLREKNFIKPLSASELAELRANVQTVNCSNCGGAIDVAHQSTCPHCGSPLSMVDMKQAETLIAELREAAAPRPIDPALPMNLIHARQQLEAAFAEMAKDRDWWHDASSWGLVEAGITALGRWLKNRQ